MKCLFAATACCLLAAVPAYAQPADTLQTDSVVISGNGSTGFGIRKLNGVEGTSIYEGRKTEVVVMSELTANKACNTARQLYAKVAGLNIWESDGGGLQLGIGGRGLSPNRSANFNVRQNGYDIAADAIGYPESYYTPPAEAVERIEVVRGAASLQYGTQFGGMVNFVMRDAPSGDSFSLTARQTLGSWRTSGTFVSAGGNAGNTKWFGYGQFRRGDGWRQASGYQAWNGYASVRQAIGQKTSLRLEYTAMHYLTQQPGGLTDTWFEQDPRVAYRWRNWFQVNWNLLALSLDHAFSATTRLNVRAFGNYSSRAALGNLARINVADLGGNRTLLLDRYRNAGVEARLLHTYSFAGLPANLLVGARAYAGLTLQQQGEASADSSADFRYLTPDRLDVNYRYPSQNFALFAENIFRPGPRTTITPGLRLEHIRTFGTGTYRLVARDMAGNIQAETVVPEALSRVRTLLLAGIGISHKMNVAAELYANFSQNYRAVTFSDIRIANPNYVVDPNIRDERGYTLDLGIRGQLRNILYYDVTAFYLRYNGQIGLLLRNDVPPLYLDYRYNTNIADSRTVGLESVAELNLLPLFKPDCGKNRVAVFVNTTVLDGRYIHTDDASIAGKRRELVPPFILRTGSHLSLGRWRASAQYSYVATHYTDATNAEWSSTAVVGKIPGYGLVDVSGRYERRRWAVDLSVNNLLNARYFTRRAVSYPGPGIIPGDGRGIFLTLEGKW